MTFFSALNFLSPIVHPCVPRKWYKRKERKILSMLSNYLYFIAQRGLKAMVTGLDEVNKCHQCSPHKCREMPTVKLQALPLKSHVTRPRHRSPWECFGSRVTVARGEYPAPPNNRNTCAKGRKTPTENHWPFQVMGVRRRANHSAL